MKLLRSSQRGFAARLDALSRRLTEVDKGVDGAVRPILEAVRRQGDAAVVRFTRRFDKARLTAKQFRVSEKEMEEAYRQGGPAGGRSPRAAAGRHTAFSP